MHVLLLILMLATSGIRNNYVLSTVQDDVGYSALIVACLGGFVEVVRVLLKHGADIDYQNKVNCD